VADSLDRSDGEWLDDQPATQERAFHHAFGFLPSKRGRPSSTITSQPAFEPTKLWYCGATPGSLSSVPRRTDTSGPSGHVPPKRLEPQTPQNAFDIPEGGR
jgi:hypothetical protein